MNSSIDTLSPPLPLSLFLVRVPRAGVLTDSSLDCDLEDAGEILHQSLLSLTEGPSSRADEGETSPLHLLLLPPSAPAVPERGGVGTKHGQIPLLFHPLIAHTCSVPSVD